MYQRNKTKKKTYYSIPPDGPSSSSAAAVPFLTRAPPRARFTTFSQRTSRPTTDLPRQLGMIGRYIEVLKISRFPGPLDNCELVPFHWVHLFSRSNRDPIYKTSGRRGLTKDPPLSLRLSFPAFRGERATYLTPYITLAPKKSISAYPRLIIWCHLLKFQWLFCLQLACLFASSSRGRYQRVPSVNGLSASEYICIYM